MPKAILEFSLPEEQEEFNLACRAGAVVDVVRDMSEWLRAQYKYDKGDISPESAEIARGHLYEMCHEYGVVDAI